MNENKNSIALQLSQDEALVLFEFLSRFSDKGELRVEDQAEERVLWDVCCLLEKCLAQPLRPDYVELLEKARAAVRNKVEGAG
jgi:hypothetical protein